MHLLDTDGFAVNKFAMFYRQTQVTICLAALRKNVAAISKRHPGTNICAVVKADAYGHGSVEVSRVLAQSGVHLLAVATVEEGVHLREAGITLPILVLGALVEEAVPTMVQYNLQATIFSSEQVMALGHALRGAELPVHLKIDTGMSRLGVLPRNLSELLTALNKYPNLRLDGVMTHLQNADLADTERNQMQLQRFQKCMAQIETAGFSPKMRHFSNSAASLSLKNAGQNLLRVGLVMYGLSPMNNHVPTDLTPLMRWTTRPLQIKQVEAGERVSYGGLFVANRKTTLAVLPVGYADGYRRSFAGKAHVLIHEKRAPVVGAICMDMCVVDVTDLPPVSIRDEVVLMGSQGEENISTYELAAWANTICYEITCGISDRVPRRYLGTPA